MKNATHLVVRNVITRLMCLLLIVLTAAPCRAQEEPNDTTVESALVAAVKYTGFPVDEQSLDEARTSARNVTLKFAGRGAEVDTSVYEARCFTFRGVALQWIDGETYVRDYDVLVGTHSDRPLLIRSPSTGDSVIEDTREETKSRHPQFRANATEALDTGLISFSSAILGCDKANPLEAQNVEAAIINYGDMFVKSTPTWDIVLRGVERVYSSHLSSDPGNVSKEERRIIDERRERRRIKYVRHFVNAITGKSLSCKIVAGYDEDGSYDE